MTAAVGPELAKVGLSYRWKTEQMDGGVIQVTCIVRHALGHSEETMLRGSPDMTGNKNNLQAVGSTVSYLSRYTLVAALGLATSDMDDDGRGGDSQLITPEQVLELQKKLSDVAADVPAFCAYLGIDAIGSLPAKGFQAALDAIDAKKRQKKSNA